MSSQFKKFSCLSEAVEHKACCGDFDECLRALHTIPVILAQSPDCGRAKRGCAPQSM